ncbi:protein LLP homolog [Cimex lectularius]|uniref:Protein LLP homolog n=1 Tax=Cimex lectularius TaxID=79782 RepID=A0A8I6TEX6_CIMLE|nr:protein LLP homolog [Cimex lectularius]
MAKSLRSKWKRKMKVIKRERYGKKELEKLKAIVETFNVKSSNDVQMTELQDCVTVISPPSTSVEQAEDNTEMECDGGKIKIYNPQTMKDQYGNYPVWMSSHRKKKIMKREKKMNKNRKRRDKLAKNIY